MDNLQTWATLVGWGVVIFGGGVGFGHLKRQTDEHQKAIDKCSSGDLMTQKKCDSLHESRQQTTDVKLDTIEKMLAEMKVDRCKIDERLGALGSKIDVMYDRWERRND